MSLAPDVTAVRQTREAIIREHIDAENRHDTPATIDTFAHPSYDVVPLDARFDGADAVTAFWNDNLRALPDFHIETGQLRHADDAVFVEVRVTGTHEGEWLGVPATGRQLNVRVGCLYEFDGDRLVCERVYFDVATILRQMGVLPDQP